MLMGGDAGDKFGPLGARGGRVACQGVRCLGVR
jgi:hypothetical protein